MKYDVLCRPSRGGFTLVETLAVVALLALIVVMATPSFVAWHVRDQVDARAKALASTLAYARSEALRRGARVTVCRIDAARAALPRGNRVTMALPTGPAAGPCWQNAAARSRCFARNRCSRR